VRSFLILSFRTEREHSITSLMNSGLVNKFKHKISVIFSLVRSCIFRFSFITESKATMPITLCDKQENINV